MSLIRDSLKKVQEKEEAPDKTIVAAPSETKTGGGPKGSRTIYLVLGVGLLLVVAVYFLMVQTAVRRPAQTPVAGNKSLPGGPTAPSGSGTSPASPGTPSAPPDSKVGPQKKTLSVAVAKADGAAVARPATLATLPPAKAATVDKDLEKEVLPGKAAGSARIMAESGGAKGPAGQGSGPEVRKEIAVEPRKTKTASAAASFPGSGRGIEADPRAQENLKKAYEQAYTWQQEGKLELAQSRYRDILAQDPYNPYVLTNLGLLYQKTGRLKEAVQSYEKAIEADPRFVPALQNLGVVWIRLGDSEEAGRWLERSLALDPDNAAALANLGIIYNKKGNRELARQYWKKSLGLDPRLPETSYNLARLEEESGNIPEAHRYYQQFIRLRNDSSDRLVQEVQRHIRDWKLPGGAP
jgi:tetratricopeptide (TPR) repeat protein